MRVWYSPRSGWLEGTKAVAVVEGVMEVLGDLDEAFGHPNRSSPTALGSRHCSERWLEGTRIKYKNASTIAIKLGPIAVPHVWDEVVTLTGDAWRLAWSDFEHCVCSDALGGLGKVNYPA